MPAVDVIVGVDFGAPRRTRDQRRKIIAIAAQLTERRHYRIDATGFNARLLATKIDGIISHCRYPLHTGLLEGINNKIKVLKRVAYGYRDQAYFFLKIRAAFPGIPC